MVFSFLIRTSYELVRTGYELVLEKMGRQVVSCTCQKKTSGTNRFLPPVCTARIEEQLDSLLCMYGKFNHLQAEKLFFGRSSWIQSQPLSLLHGVLLPLLHFSVVTDRNNKY
jgi:hypothetical protein